MKKITLWLFAFFASWQINAQVSINEGFEATTIPTGWTYASFARSTVTPCVGVASVRRNFWASGPTGSVTTVNFVAGSNGEQIDISFDWQTTEFSLGDGVGVSMDVQYSTDNGTNWNTIGNISSNTITPCTTWTGSLPAGTVPNGSDFRMRFNGTHTGGDCYFYIDNIQVTQQTFVAPNCTSIISPADGAVNVSSGLISWSAATGAPTGYKLNVGTSPGGTDVLNGFDVGNVLSYNIGALTGSTTYYVTIIPYNTNGDATGCTETSFSSCNINIAPWSYDVEAAAATTNASIADCWSTIPVGPTTTAYRWNVDAAGGTPSGLGTGPSGANSGVKYFYTEASSGVTGAVAELYTPLVDLSGLTDPSLQFFYHMNGVAMGELRVDVFDGTTWTNDVFVLVGSQQTVAADPWIEAIVSLNAYIGNTVQVRFRSIRGTTFSSDMALDDITFDEAPACFDPINLGAANITATTVDVLFTDGSGGNQFDFAYVVQPQGTGAPTTYPAGTPEDGSNQINATDFSIPVSGLNSNTPYEIYVAADCNGNWIGPFNFRTLCDTFTAPFNEPFATNVLPSCWTQGGVTPWEYGSPVTTPAGFAGWGADAVPDFNGAGGTFIGIDGSDHTNGEVSTLLTPFIDISTLTTPRLKYAVFSNNVDDAAQNLLEVEVWDGSSWNLVNSVQANLGTNWVVFTTDLTTLTVTGPIQIRYTVTGVSNGGSTFYNDILIDDVTVEETPSTPPACATNVVGTPDVSCGNFNNVLTWDAVSGADGYSLTIGTTPGGNEILDNQDLGNAVLYNFTGSVNTTYYFTVVPYNANGPATGCAEVSFTTNANGCYCIPTYTNGGANDAITNVVLGTLSNASTGNVTPFYEDFTGSQPATIAIPDLSAGTTVVLAVTMGTDGNQFSRVWIDFNQNLTFEPSESFSTGTNAGGSGTSNISITIPPGATLGQTRMRIRGGDDDAINDTQACGASNSAWGQTEDYFVNIIAATCSPAVVASSTIVPDCGNGQFSVDIDVTALGDGTPVVSDGTTTWPVAATGIVTVGPFADGATVSLSVLHGVDNTCDLPLGNFSNTCPAANDDLCNAIPLVVNAISTGSQYNNLGATAEVNEPVATCFSNGIYGSVWFSFVAPASGEVIITTDIAGATLTDTEIALYDSTGVNCSDLSTLGAEIGCDQDGGTTINFNSILAQAGLTPGTTYYIQVDVWNAAANGVFGIEVQEVLSSDSFDNNNFMAYPNPVKDVLNLSYTSEISAVQVVNMLGQEVISRNLNATTAQVDMSQLSAGAYIVNVTIGDTVKTIKVVKQ